MSCLIDLELATRHLLWRDIWLPKLVEVGHGHAPVGHGTIGVFRDQIAKRFLRGRVGKRM